MKIEIEPTGHFETVNGQNVRIWRGKAANGAEVVAYVALIRTDAEHCTEAQACEFDRELQQVKAERSPVSFDTRLAI